MNFHFTVQNQEFVRKSIFILLQSLIFDPSFQIYYVNRPIANIFRIRPTIFYNLRMSDCSYNQFNFFLGR